MSDQPAADFCRAEYLTPMKNRFVCIFAPGHAGPHSWQTAADRRTEPRRRHEPADDPRGRHGEGERPAGGPL